ncbi:MAG: AraC family transcriptional regulator [Burkholderiales bacterium]|nr:MAG: AraC family transcriptional regulator [Burkholderiales bacterium]
MRLLTLSLDAFDGPVHTHPMLELTRIERGSGLRFIADTVEPFAAGDLVLVAPRVGHAWWTGRADRGPGAAAATVLQFHVAPVLDGLPEWMPTLGALLQERAAAWVIHEELARELGPALQALAGTERLELLGLGLALLARIAAPAAARWRRPLGTRALADDEPNELMARRVDQLLTWIRDHLHDELTVAAAAAQLHVSPAAFSRSFKRLVGRSFTDYVNDLRIAEVQLLLRRTDRPVTEIAAACGFTTLSNFNAHFRRRLGMSPRDYRRR